MKTILVLCTALLATPLFSQFAPPVGEPGTTAISKDSSAIINWANEVIDFERGLADITNPDGDLASFGFATDALGVAEGTATAVVSLGDSGVIVLGFPFAIRNGEGPDFAVFENSFSNTYLELAHVEVSTDGERWVRFPSISNIQTMDQTGTFATTEADLIYNLAGKYKGGFGTPFDLEDLVDSTGIDLEEINFVKIIDVVGSIDPAYGTRDSEGTLINDPFKTDFESGGFDLDAVGVINDLDPTASVRNDLVTTVQCFPNPFTGIINVKSEFLISKILIFDLLGNQIAEFDNTTTVNFATISASYGSYILVAKLENEQQYITKINYIN